MSDPVDVFMHEGITRYAEAQQTVKFFREQVFDVLEASLRSELGDGAVRLCDRPELRRGADESGRECWIELFANAQRPSGKIVRVQLGILWNSLVDPRKAPCVVYVNLRDDAGEDARFAFRTDPRWPDVRELPIPRWTRLGVTVSGAGDLHMSLRTLLTAFRASLESER